MVLPTVLGLAKILRFLVLLGVFPNVNISVIVRGIHIEVSTEFIYLYFRLSTMKGGEIKASFDESQLKKFMVIQYFAPLKGVTSFLANKARFRMIMLSGLMRFRINGELIEPLNHIISIALNFLRAVSWHIKD